MSLSGDRASHWVKLNHQCRIPGRWIVFDTESKSDYSGDQEIQSWRMGTGIRWRHGLKRGDQAESSAFSSPEELWTWVTTFCRSGQRTVILAHNLGHDVRISRALDILPALGWRLEWCNLDRNVSSMTWRSDHGTLVFADTWTWLPVRLETIAPSVGLRKLNMPSSKAKDLSWRRYCMRDCEILYRVVKELVDFIAVEDLGNWQPTGAGMAYATWRHKFMTHKVLVHDDADALAAERAAMHTGRAEAWRHGQLTTGMWSEVDMKDAYIRIAAECDLPGKLRYKTGVVSNADYRRLADSHRCLCLCSIRTDLPCVPYNTGTKIIWPVGTFTSWLWDTEIDLLLDAGQEVSIRSMYLYTRAPILSEWARWILGITGRMEEGISPVVRTWAKHCGRALIGRLALRCPQWKQFGDNPSGETGISYDTDMRDGTTHRMMHIGNQTLIETDRTEGRDSLPAVTGWVMAECRARLWRAMRAAGLDQVAHVDTDALVVSTRGLAALRAAEGCQMAARWAVKGTWRRMIVYGPRNYRAGALRKTSGVPRKAVEVLPNVFRGERWTGLASDIEAGRSGNVTVVKGKWEMTKRDPRRNNAPGAGTETAPIYVAEDTVAGTSSSVRSGAGA